MAEAPTFLWKGNCGTYKYQIYPVGTSFDNNDPGNYIYAKQVQPDCWAPCYIGQTENIGRRLRNHEEETCAKQNGATHTHVHLSLDGEASRKAEEKDLIMYWDPPCNDHYVD